MPCNALEQGAYKDLEGHIFPIGSENKGKDGDMLRTSKEKMATYIGTKYGDDVAQEWSSKKCAVIPKPTYSKAILDRHAERVQATRDQVNIKLNSLQQESLAIDNEIKQAPTDRKLMTEKQDILDQILHCEINLKDEVKMKLMDDKKMAHNITWQSHRKVMGGLKKSRGKIYSLLLGQCTQVLIDKMKQDVDWVTISDLFDPIALFKLIEKFVLKQSNNQYRMAVLIAEQLLILEFRQDDQVTNATYYDCFTTRMEVTKQAGVCYYNPDLLDMKAMELGKVLPFTRLLDIEQKAIIELVKQEYLAYLFLNNSNQKMHTQLKKDMANNYS